jgi:putative PIN family toxin of toxin-antitoxin system
MGSTPRFVLDTNVIVSALLLPDSKPRDAFNRALDSGKIMISISVFVELEAVLSRGKFDKYLTGEWRKEFLAALVREVDFVDIAEVIAVCRDPKDDKFLELAVAGRADCLITGDPDLLALHPF